MLQNGGSGFSSHFFHAMPFGLMLNFVKVGGSTPCPQFPHPCSYQHKNDHISSFISHSESRTDCGLLTVNIICYIIWSKKLSTFYKKEFALGRVLMQKLMPKKVKSVFKVWISFIWLCELGFWSSKVVKSNETFHIIWLVWCKNINTYLYQYFYQYL